MFEGSLKNLVRIVNQQKEDRSKVQASESTAKMGNKTRNVVDLKHLIRNVLSNELGFNFDLQDNNKIKQLKDDFESELLSLVEIVLLNKHGYTHQKDRAVLEQRLAQLTNPVGTPNQ